MKTCWEKLLLSECDIEVRQEEITIVDLDRYTHRYRLNKEQDQSKNPVRKLKSSEVYDPYDFIDSKDNPSLPETPVEPVDVTTNDNNAKVAD